MKKQEKNIPNQNDADNFNQKKARTVAAMVDIYENAIEKASKLVSLGENKRVSLSKKEIGDLVLRVLENICSDEYKNFSLEFSFEGLENNIMISKTPKESIQERMERLGTRDIVIESLYDIPEGWIVVTEAAVTTGLSRDKIKNLVNSKKIQSVKVGYRSQFRTLINKNSLYKIRPKIK